MKKIVGSGLIEKEGKFLLVNAKVVWPKGLWNNPGGHQDVGESLKETVRREVKEETGFIVDIGRLIGTYISGDTTKYVYEVKIISGELSLPNDEISEANWFTIDEVKLLMNITFGAFRSVIDYSEGRFNQEYSIDKIP